MQQPLILSIDIGSSSVRAALYDSNTNAIKGTSVKSDHSFSVTPDGKSELNSLEAFDQVVSTIDKALEKSARIKGEIEYVVSCSFWHSLVGVDRNGNPTPGVLGWADTRSREYAEILRKKFDEREIHRRTGARLHSSYWPAKLLWLKTEFSSAFDNAAGLYSFSDFLALKLFDQPVTSISMASGTGLFDIRKCGWDKELVKALSINPELLPVIAEDGSTFRLNKTFAKRWPRLATAEWFPTIADGAADNIGAGCVTQSRAALMVGTSGAMRVGYAGEPAKKIPDGLWCYRIDSGRVIIGGALSDGGGLYHWLKKNLKLPNDAEERIAHREPGAHGLTFLPFLAGERGTGYHEQARGAVLGLTSATDSVDILQAALESVAYRFAEICEQLSEVVKITEIVASGGALCESSVWPQMIADCLGRDLLINNAKESSSRGAVLLALESIGRIKDIQQYQVSNEHRVTANPARFASYRKAMTGHAQAYKLLIK